MIMLNKRQYAIYQKVKAAYENYNHNSFIKTLIQETNLSYPTLNKYLNLIKNNVEVQVKE